MVGIGESGPEPFPSDASAKTSSSFSEFSEIISPESHCSIARLVLDGKVDIPKSWAPGSSSSTLFRGGSRVGLFGGSGVPGIMIWNRNAGSVQGRETARRLNDRLRTV